MKRRTITLIALSILTFFVFAKYSKNDHPSIEPEPLAKDRRTVPRQKHEAAPFRSIQEPLARDLPEAFRKKDEARADLNKYPHQTPNSVMASAAALGEMDERLAKDPSQKPLALDFYKRCLEDSESLTVTRVQCLRRYLKLSSLDDSKRKELLTELPLAVQNLYRKAESRL